MNIFRRHALPALFLLLAVFCFGCGPRGPVRYPVAGTVTFNGEPIENGDIIFEPVGEEIVPDAGKITAGAFRFESQAGVKRVKIYANHPRRESDPVMGMASGASYIPLQYNSQSTTEIDVTPAGPNQYTFELTGTPLK